MIVDDEKEITALVILDFMGKNQGVSCFNGQRVYRPVRIMEFLKMTIRRIARFFNRMADYKAQGIIELWKVLEDKPKKGGGKKCVTD